jgi:hypothetical protein
MKIHTDFPDRRLLRGFGSLALALGLAFLITACDADFSSKDEVGPDPKGLNARKRANNANYGTSVFGEGGLEMFGGGKKGEEGGGAGIGVNSFLWRASLDTLSFMPLASADPFGGVIITDWHSPLESPHERFKMTVYILDRALRSDGIRVSLFRQTKESGAWVDAPINGDTVTALEDRILERARQLRTTALGD